MSTLTEGIYIIGSLLTAKVPNSQALVPAPTTLPFPVPDVPITLGGFNNQLYMSATKADKFSITAAGENVWNISVPNQNSYLKVVGVGSKMGEEVMGEGENLELEKDDVDIPRVIAGPKKGTPAELFRFTKIDRK
ncbi:hypothetical protein Clacol_009561 [Clathrus columnatus]|uniref:Uncharacterized protein n=1 Tax=Clathrus columnatus TaxID=1419009 RepID=A0AAV5ALG9_9AGAM|nr:hypothetical protein Clacol_009561 [Clathrus columnatus]